MEKILLIPKGTKTEEAAVSEPTWKTLFTEADLPTEKHNVTLTRSMVMNAAQALVKDDRKIEAVKLLRTYVNAGLLSGQGEWLGLLDAKDYVESISSGEDFMVVYRYPDEETFMNGTHLTYQRAEKMYGEMSAERYEFVRLVKIVKEKGTDVN